MNAYRRPGYPSVPASYSHILNAVGAHGPLAAQFLAAEERHRVDAMRSELNRCRRESRAMSSSQAAISLRLRQTIGSALVRLGARLSGTPATIATTGAAG